MSRVERIGGATLVLGDCRDVLPTLSGVDAVVTDPPYGIEHKSHGQLFREAVAIVGDGDLTLAHVVRAWATQRGIPFCCFFSPYRPLTGFRNVLCWSKGEHVGIGGDRETCWKRDFELIGVEGTGNLQGRRDSAVIGINAVLPPTTGHFAEKPIGLLRYLLNKIDCDAPLDPCMGSGTTGVAAVSLGLSFIGIEIDERWFDVACRRIEAAQRQRDLFHHAPVPVHPVETQIADLFAEAAE